MAYVVDITWPSLQLYLIHFLRFFSVGILFCFWAQACACQLDLVLGLRVLSRASVICQRFCLWFLSSFTALQMLCICLGLMCWILIGAHHFLQSHLEINFMCPNICSLFLSLHSKFGWILFSPISTNHNLHPFLHPLYLLITRSCAHIPPFPISIRATLWSHAALSSWPAVLCADGAGLM